MFTKILFLYNKTASNVLKYITLYHIVLPLAKSHLVVVELQLMD